MPETPEPEGAGPHGPIEKLMPEPPDFEQIAHSIAMSVPAVTGAAFILHRTHIAEQLRQVWNARGAADLDAIAGELPPQYHVVTADQIRRVDR